MHLDVQYECDESGLLLRPRSKDVAAPSLHLVRTADGNSWLLSAALSHEERTELGEIFAREAVFNETGEMEDAAPLLGGDGKRLGEYRGPAFHFPESLPAAGNSAELLHDATDAQTVPELSWIRDAKSAEHPLAVVRNPAGEIVSVCHSARSTAGGAEAGVETAPGYRGHSFAVAVVLLWAATVRAEGRIPLYSTQWTNHASRAVARKLGLVMYGEDHHD